MLLPASEHSFILQFLCKFLKVKGIQLGDVGWAIHKHLRSIH